ncbi:hypothetical protein [Cellulomonas sp. URHD0024]|uniref:hypothetical protein n=1 Tax=Cellulomonas sp. URHD0024 TaxID=1302620 RepID=UPI00040B3BB9|nr:hypothetical protein [Cellulomonas sp. URHD0024]
MTTDLRARPGRSVAVGLAVAMFVVALVGGTLAVGAWSTTTATRDGGACGSAFHYHPGSAFEVHGGEMSDAERTRLSDECDADGAVPWRVGITTLAVTGALLVALAGRLLVPVSRRGRPVSR